MQRLYVAIASVSKCGVIVDSSKTASGAFLLREGHVEPYLVHVVRDSPAVVFAWSKRVVRPEVTDRVTYMGRRTTLRAAAGWTARNLLCHVVEHTGVPRLLVRYESLTSDPRRQMERIVRFVDPSTTADLSGFDDREVEVRPIHTVAGNPVRFRRGRSPIHPAPPPVHRTPGW